LEIYPQFIATISNVLIVNILPFRKIYYIDVILGESVAR